jgi:hypothetical protein
MTTKICASCKQEMNVKAFSKNSRSSDGLQSRCKVCCAQYGRAYYRQHVDEAKQYAKDRRKRLQDEVFSAYGEICVCCGESNRAFLTIDHVDGGGTQHRRDIGSADSLYLTIIREGFPDDYQVLCYNCNNAKHRFGVCPHQQKLRAVN